MGDITWFSPADRDRVVISGRRLEFVWREKWEKSVSRK